VILKPNFDVYKITMIPFAVAVALHNAIQKTLKLKTELKWPNDLTLNGKKVAGIIIDASIESTRIESVVIGIGINFKIDPKEIESKIKPRENFYGVNTLVKNDKAKPSNLVKAFLEELENTLTEIEENKTQTIIKHWVKNSSTIGRQIKVRSLDSTISGKAVNLDKDGSLVLKQGSKIIRVTSGDISY